MHVTGGGIPEKMVRVLRPSGLGARLDNLFEPPQIMRYCQRAGVVSDADAYNAWNMGQGMMLVTPEPEKVLAAAKKAGIATKIAGEIIREPKVVITSKGVETPGKELTYTVK